VLRSQARQQATGQAQEPGAALQEESS
jgi:hypothetical protein